MLTLILMRHAKSSWDNAALRDHDRPLNDRGARSATALGAWLREKGVVPDQILSSSSTRTRQTGSGLGLAAPSTFTGDLYHASEAEMLGLIRAAGEGETLLVIGHNPGIAELAHGLVKSQVEHPRFWDYPTGATLVLRFNINDWADVDWQQGVPVDFVIPRELPGV